MIKYLCKACFSPSLCVFHPIWVLGGGPKGSRAHNLLMQFSRLSSSKMEISETDFFDTLTIQNDQISYVKHVLAPLYVFFTLFGCWGGALPRGIGHNLLMQFSRLSSSKMEISETDFFDTLSIQNDGISYVKHVLAPLYVFFTLFGCWGGALPRGIGHNLLMQFSRLSSSKMEISETDFFDTLSIQNDQISYVKHVLAPLYVFFTLFGCWGGALPRGIGHNLLMQFSRLSSSKKFVPLPSSRCLAEGNRFFPPMKSPPTARQSPYNVSPPPCVDRDLKIKKDRINKNK